MKSGPLGYIALFMTGLSALSMSAAASEAAHPSDVLWYKAPAQRWVEALPVGNGRLGAMIFGRPEKERLQLNDITVWSLSPQPDADRKDAYTHLPELRRLIREGRYDRAAEYARRHYNGPAPYDASYQTLGDLDFEFVLPSETITDYRRYLDIGQALAGVAFTAGEVNFQREIFSSAPDHILVKRITADRKGAISFSMRLSRIERAKTEFIAPDTLVMTGTTGRTLRYEVRARILTQGGRLSGSGDSLTVDQADEAIVLLTAGTNFVLDYDAGYTGGDPGVAASHMQAACDKDYTALKADHVIDYRRYFDRVKLNAGNSLTDIPTDERLKAFGDGKADPGFATLFYQYGRYLLISSSRPDNPLPSNSQGIWGDGLDLPWKCDYKSNINYQMLYWAAESSNLAEMHTPMLRMTQNLVRPGTRTAHAYFGPDTPGWVVGYTTNGWSWTSPGRDLPWGIWFGGSAWYVQHLWDHYAYNRDVEYLRSVYPTMKGAAAFWLANLVEGTDGKLITSPSTSPENTFRTDDGIRSSICEGATMEKSLVWDLFTNVALASNVLGVDADFRAKLEAARDRIRPPQIGRHGQIMEWGGDWDNPDDQHRHISHLFGLHPGHEINPRTTPELAEASKVTLRHRGDGGTGWALAWKINFWARLLDGDHAYTLITHQLNYTSEDRTIYSVGGTYPNLFCAHPPFQIDGNMGFVSGVNEMLLQSHQRYTDPAYPDEDRYIIDLLPALPAAWPDGSVMGLRARGGVEIDLIWRDGRLTSATLTAAKRGTFKIRYGDQMSDLTLPAGTAYTFAPSRRE